MSDKISPYIFPGLKYEMLDSSKHPYLKPLKDRMGEHEVIKVILEKFGITHEMMVSKERKRALVDVRLVVTYILRKKLGCTYTHIGHMIGNRDHTTAIHNERKFMDVYETEVGFRRKANIVFDKLGIEPWIK
jgi:chromosomal replication initiator protein